MRATLLGAALLGVLALAGPAEARILDPRHSRVEAQAPVLAPGVWGTAPLYGEMYDSGAFSLRAPTAAIETGNQVYNGILRQVLGGSIVLTSGPPTLLREHGGMRRMRAWAHVRAGAAAADVALIVRTFRGAGGTTLRTYFSLPLAPYGVINPAGGSPGSVRVAITAFFPDR